jgi:hypothetical protein
VDFVDEIVCQCEYRADVFTLAFGEVVDSIFIGHTGLSAADHVQVKCVLDDGLVALLAVVFDALDSDAVEVGVVEQVENSARVIVELTNPRMKIPQPKLATSSTINVPMGSTQP